MATNVPIDSLDGWTLCYANSYASGDSLAYVQGVCNQANLLLGCRPVGSSELSVAAHAPRADVLLESGSSNTPHVANGVGWYYSNDWSWGFAPEGATINRNQCDLVASSLQGGTDPTLRLCWHTFGNSLISGWRCGATDSLNGSTAFERLIFEAP